MSRTRRAIAVAGVLAAALAILGPGTAGAAEAPESVSGVTAPSGTVRLGSSLWISDHLLGFCRIDGGAVNTATCNTSAGAAGQPVYDASRGFVYIPDYSSKSRGVVRLRFNPAGAGTVGTPVVIATGLGRNRPVAAALAADGTLFVSTLKSAVVSRVRTPYAVTQTVAAVGRTSDGRGAISLALSGDDLYVAETARVAVIRGAATCTTCVMETTGIPATSPSALAADVAADGSRQLYVAETPLALSTVLRHTIETGITEEYLREGTLVDGTKVALRNVSGLGVDPNGDLYVGDDPTAGASVLQGHVWGPVARGSEPAPPPGPRLVEGIVGASLASGLTAPGGVVALNGDIWVSDHLLGLCRVDGGVVVQSTCSPTPATTGGIAVDAARNVIYVADNSSQSQGVWRLAYDPATRTVGSPTLIYGGAQVGALRPTAVAVDRRNGSIVVGFLKSPNIVRITSPFRTPVATVIGTSSDGRAAPSLAIVGARLYIAEDVSVTSIASFALCTGTCVATATTIAVEGPVALAAVPVAGNTVLYVAEFDRVLRVDTATGVQEVLSNTKAAADGTQLPYQMISTLGFGVSGELLVGDDPSAGDLVLLGALTAIPLA